MSISYGHKTKRNSNFVFGAIIILLTYQSYVRSKFSHKQEPDSILHWPPTDELDCTRVIYDSHEMLMKTENHLQDSELRSIHMSIK